MQYVIALLLLMAITIDFNRDVNRHFKPLIYDKHETLILWGGSSSGKSHFVSQKLIYRAMTETGHNFAIFRKYRPAVKATCWRLIKGTLDGWGLAGAYTENLTELNIGLRGNNFFFIGLDDPTKLKSLPKISGAWFEETTEFTPDERRLAMNYVRGNIVNYKQIIHTFNPVSKFNSVYDEYFARPLPKEFARYDHSTYQDNDWMLKNDPQWVAWMERQKDIDPNFYQVYGLGEWGELKGLIFPNVKVEEFLHPLSYFDSIVGGQDWGYSDPASFILVGLKDKKAYCIDEIYITNQDVQETQNGPGLIKLTKQLFQIWGLSPADVVVYADHEPDRIDAFNAAGFNYNEAEKDVKVKNQISHLQQYEIVVHPRCTNMIAEDRTYKWIEKDGRTTEKPLEFRNHAEDARRYAIFSRYFESVGGADFFVV